LLQSIGPLPNTAPGGGGNKMFGDPCTNTGKWLVVVVDCGGWGWTFVALLLGGAALCASSYIAARSGEACDLLGR
jgi:hypothetical protein